MRRAGTILSVPWFLRTSERKRTTISRKIRKRTKAAKMKVKKVMTRMSYD